MSNLANTKPHAVLIPFPAQGHINALLKLAKLLHLRGFHITFVNTEYNHKRLLKSRGPNSLDGINGFNFETIPDGLTPIEGNGDVTQDIYSLIQSIMTKFLRPFDELLTKLHDSATAGVIPPITCLVSDCFMPFAIEAAEKHELPTLIFNPCSACTFVSTLHLATLFQNGVLPIKDEKYLTNGYLDTKLELISGLQSFRLSDHIHVIKTTNPNDVMIKYMIEIENKCRRGFAIVFNTSNELESDAMNILDSMFPSLYTIGPFVSFLNQSPHNHLTSLDSSLWKEDTKCLEWLEPKAPGSVVYVNFGSITVMSPEKLLEFAWGLAYSKKPFLWIIRPDLVIGGSVVLSLEFVNEISDRALITSWCPQERVLNHPSIGGFLTHCGWNSTIESICAGVPMLCWPFYGDQLANCRFICNELEIGIEINSDVKRKEVKKLVKELMVGEKGKKMKEKAIELKKKVEEETRPGGCSYMNLDKVIKNVLLRQSKI
ncbi:7-deoxyloganetin glucosyltransferase [Trifolium repens]|nr:7-deoxyloganetin glucosyltransferase [Trifolium repens]